MERSLEQPVHVELSTGMSLTYNPPKKIVGQPVIVLEAPEIAKQTDEWNNALVMYTL